MPPELEFRPPARPGNFGGETYRQYCGLPGPRVAWGKRREDAGPVTAQRLYAAIGRRGEAVIPMPDQCPYARVACFSGVMLCEVKRGGDARSGRFRKWWRGALGAYDCHCGGILPCALCAAKQKRDRKGEP